MLRDDKPFFCRGFKNYSHWCDSMDKSTQTKTSIVSFIIGLIMLFIPYLKNFDAVIPGISQYFSLMFYLGLVLVVAGYYLK
jgi:hypothetical protein